MTDAGSRFKRQIRHGADDQLLLAISEHLKLPLLQIARRAELASVAKRPRLHLETIRMTADAALRLLDGYVLSVRLAARDDLLLEPVSVSAALYDVAQEISTAASQYNIALKIDIAGRYEPVMAHSEGLRAALTNLAYDIIEAEASQMEDGTTSELTLAAHRGRGGIVAGLFGANERFQYQAFERARHVYGHARLAMPEVSAGSGAGIFVADALFDSMSARLRVAKHNSLAGLAATLYPSRQLQLI